MVGGCWLAKSMSTGPGRRALSFAYLVPYSAVAGSLILLGCLLDLVPALPASVSDRYQRTVLAVLAGLARPVDGLTEQSPEPVAGGLTGESAP